MVSSEEIRTIRYKQQTFRCGQYVMFTPNPRKPMVIGEVAVPRDDNLWVVYKDHHGSMIGCPQDSVIYIRPATRKEVFVAKLEGKI